MMTCLWACWVLTVGAAAPPAATVLFVDDDAPPGGDGLSWGTAHRFLQNALLDAWHGTEIRVAGGLYRPDRFEAFPDGTGDREDTFLLGPGEMLRGGYAGVGAANPDHRDPELYESILSGDLAGDDDPDDFPYGATYGENSYHVVWGSFGDEQTLLDGFVITAGYANGEVTLHRRGAGMYMEDADLTVANCTFIANAASFSGAGLLNIQANGKIVGCQFVGNQIIDSAGRGAAVQLAGSNALVVDCLFSGNTATVGSSVAGGMEILGSPTLVNCVFADNTAHAGGAINNLGPSSNPTLINCTFSRNTDSFGGSVMWNAQGHPTFVNCVIWDNADPQFGGGGVATFTYCAIEGGWYGDGNIDADPLFVDPDHGDFRLSPDSPCIDAGDNTAVPEGITTDHDGKPRFLEIPETPDTGHGDLPIVDMGAYESLGGGCLAVLSQEVVCHGDGTTFTVNVEGLNACTGSTTMVTFTGAGGAVGEDFCATLLVNTEQGGFCCSTQLCVPVPDCSAAALPCDLDGDGVIGITDFLVLLGAWGSCADCGDCVADVDGDCTVGVNDFLALLSNWG